MHELFSSGIKTQGGDVSDRQTDTMGSDPFMKILNSARLLSSLTKIKHSSVTFKQGIQYEKMLNLKPLSYLHEDLPSETMSDQVYKCK